MLFVYYPRDSFLHKIDAVSKAIWLFAIAVAVLFAADPIQNFLVFAYVLFIGFVVGKIPLGALVRRLLYVTWLAFGILLIMTLTFPKGTSQIASLGPLSITEEGINYGIAMFFRIMTLGASSMVYALTTHPRDE
jgi:energy-coupling factor transport system permease protein